MPTQEKSKGFKSGEYSGSTTHSQIQAAAACWTAWVPASAALYTETSSNLFSKSSKQTCSCVGNSSFFTKSMGWSSWRIIKLPLDPLNIGIGTCCHWPSTSWSVVDSATQFIPLLNDSSDILRGDCYFFWSLFMSAFCFVSLLGQCYRILIRKIQFNNSFVFILYRKP